MPGRVILLSSRGWADATVFVRPQGRESVGGDYPHLVTKEAFGLVRPRAGGGGLSMQLRLYMMW